MNAKIVSPVLGLIVWLGLAAAGLNSITAFIIGAVAGYLFGPALAKIFGGIPKDPSKGGNGSNRS
jgi:hypothetical protein